MNKAIPFKITKMGFFAINVGYLSHIDITKSEYSFTSWQVDNETLVFRFTN